MALIKCSECSAEISNKASCCPKCGAPVVVHKWRCNQCGNMISEEPCPYCSDAQTAVNTNTVAYEGSVSTTPAFVAKNKRNLRVLITVLVVVAIAIIIFVLQDDKGGNTDSPGSIVVHGKVSDFYDDNGDGWVDRAYNRTIGRWAYFEIGEYPIANVG